MSQDYLSFNFVVIQNCTWGDLPKRISDIMIPVRAAIRNASDDLMTSYEEEVGSGYSDDVRFECLAVVDEIEAMVRDHDTCIGCICHKDDLILLAAQVSNDGCGDSNDAMTAMYRFWEIVERLKPHGFEVDAQKVVRSEDEPNERRIMHAPKEVDEDG